MTTDRNKLLELAKEETHVVDGLIYVLRDGVNYYEINVTMAEGSRDNVARHELAAQISDLLQAQGEPVALTLETAPVGTTARSINGGHWFKTERGWKWNGPDGSGGTFPRPGGDWNGKLTTPEAPQPQAAQREDSRDAVRWRAFRMLGSEIENVESLLEPILTQVIPTNDERRPTADEIDAVADGLIAALAQAGKEGA